MKIIDLTHLLSENITVYPGSEKPVFKSVSSIEENGYAETKISMFSHTGTHIDAPGHLLKGGKTLEQLPVERYTGKGLCIDCTFVKSKIIDKKYLLEYEENIKQVDFVLLRTGWSEKWNNPDYFIDYPVLNREACEWLISHNLKGIGVDTISVDSMDSKNMENHQAILANEILIIENLTNLCKLTSEYFLFICFPIKFQNSDGSPIRAIAIYN